MKILPQPLEFEWDRGNRNKNFIKHKVTDEECEEIFFDVKKKVLKDVIHSDKEERYIMIGQTKIGRLLFIVFTFRKNKLRVISARDLNKKEKNLYEETIKYSKI
jgi:uncharacterized DUF497 family protein